MWCPSCQVDSPLVSLQPEGLVCARCQTEVDIAVGRNQRAATEPHLLTVRKSLPAKGLKLATVLASDNPIAARPDESQGMSSGPGASNDTGTSDWDRSSISTDELSSCSADEPLFRFDPAHSQRPGRNMLTIRESEDFFEEAVEAIRTRRKVAPVPRTFLFLRANNPWPARWTFLASALFLAGQSWLLWSSLRGWAWGVAGGVLSSTWAFAMALYVIAQYCDEDR